MEDIKNKPKTFCTAPFTILFMGATGENRLCCVSLNPILDHTVERNGVERTFKRITKVFPKDIQKDVWTSDYFKDVRRRMLNGETIEECKRCYEIEESGGRSDRMTNNEVIERYIDDDFSFNIETGNNKNVPIDLDIRPSNLCNLKCRMCFSDSSSRIGKEVTENPKLLEVIPGIQDVGLVDWFSDQSMQDQMKSIIPHTVRLKLLGGETTIVEKVHDLLRWCIDKGYNKSLVLDITTNLTNTNDEFFNLIKQFSHTNVCVSVDGIGEVNDYIRYPSKWRIIERNLNKYLTDDLPDGNRISLHILSTVSIYNVLYLPELIDWIYSLPDPHSRFGGNGNNRVLICPVSYPPWQNINLLPQHARGDIIDRLNICIANNIEGKYLDQSRMAVIVNELSNGTNDATEENYNIFINSTKLYDQIRNQDLKASLPEVYNLFKKDLENDNDVS